MTFEEKIKNKQLYFCDHPGFMEAQQLAMDELYEFNHSRPSEKQKRLDFYNTFFAKAGKNLHIEPPLHANWGKNTHWGDNCYANFGLTLVDDTDIFIGDYVLFAPNVVVTTTGHPVHPELRQKTAQFSIPVTIGNNVWIGANAVILPGISIGDNSVIGAGSIVTKNIPSNVVAVGNPCKILRKIGEHDMKYYYKDLKITAP